MKQCSLQPLALPRHGSNLCHCQEKSTWAPSFLLARGVPFEHAKLMRRLKRLKIYSSTKPLQPPRKERYVASLPNAVLLNLASVYAPQNFFGRINCYLQTFWGYGWWNKSWEGLLPKQRSWMTEIPHRRTWLEKTTLKRRCGGYVSHRLVPCSGAGTGFLPTKVFIFIHTYKIYIHIYIYMYTLTLIRKSSRISVRFRAGAWNCWLVALQKISTRYGPVKPWLRGIKILCEDGLSVCWRSSAIQRAWLNSWPRLVILKRNGAMDPNNFITPGILAQNVANGRCGNSSGFFQVEAKTILVILVRSIIAVTCWNRLGYQQYFGQNTLVKRQVRSCWMVRTTLKMFHAVCIELLGDQGSTFQTKLSKVKDPSRVVVGVSRGKVWKILRTGMFVMDAWKNLGKGSKKKHDSHPLDTPL